MPKAIINLTDDIINVLNKHGYQLGNKLGSGYSGYAYNLKDNNNAILKVTKDEAEFISSNHIVGKKLENVCNIYKCFKLKNVNDLFFIEQEKLIPAPRNDITEMLNLLQYNKNKNNEQILLIIKSLDFKNSDTILKNTKNIVTDIINKKRDLTGNQINNMNIEAVELKNLINKFKDIGYKAMSICYIYDLNYEDFATQLIHGSNKLVSNLSQLVNGLMELISNEIQFDDVTQSNIMQKSNGQLALIDLGFSKSPTNKFEIIEQLFKKFK